MTQSYFITVRTTGPYNANKSTRELCSVIQRKFDNTLIYTRADIKKVFDYVKDKAASISDKNKRCKPLKASYIWESSHSDDCAHTCHFTVGIDGTVTGEDTFLQVDFTSVRHSYNPEHTISDSHYVQYCRTPKPSFKKADLDKLTEGDIIVSDDHDTIMIVKNYSNQKLTTHIYFDSVGLQVTPVSTGTHDSYHYATEEERIILFNEMHVAGLRWNFIDLEVEQIP